MRKLDAVRMSQVQGGADCLTSVATGAALGGLFGLGGAIIGGLGGYMYCQGYFG
jgi:hypothetical protein